MKIGILAVQGAFLEQEAVLDQLNVSWKEIRRKKDLDDHFDGLILPGGESTVQGKLLRELHLFHPLLEMIQQDIPVLATCAGMILLSEKIGGQTSPHLKTIPMNVMRNAYGRQLASFHTTAEYRGLGKVPMTFIRAPYVSGAAEGVKILSTVDHHIVAVQYRNQTALSFHPELDQDLRIHQDFLGRCR
ncbi:MAG: pyridoxal 5'-phosphate synthase glutaminase subunit PdxT [Lachnospiraceae bacterium]|nr:pyridoxal 5'-phosphate synthase glutaminase subunit PdxT [Lachnospiraceae bacterium]